MARKAGPALVAALAMAVPASADPARVVALGDSLTAGYGLPAAQGFVAQLQRWLDANGVDATIVNAGVSGDTTAGGLARLDWTLDAQADAVIVALGGNDLLRGVPVASSRANLDGILAEATGERGLPVLLVGISAPGNYGPAYQRDFDAMYVDLGAKWDALVEPHFLGALLEGVPLAEARARYMQPDGIHPNAEGVARIVETLGPRVAELVARAEG